LQDSNNRDGQLESRKGITESIQPGGLGLDDAGLTSLHWASFQSVFTMAVEVSLFLGWR
jgi:hypothetical protein